MDGQTGETEEGELDSCKHIYYNIFGDSHGVTHDTTNVRKSVLNNVLNSSGK